MPCHPSRETGLETWKLTELQREERERERERDTEFRVFWLDVLFINVCNIEGVFSNCAIPTWLTGENGFSKLWKQSTSTEYN